MSETFLSRWSRRKRESATPRLETDSEARRTDEDTTERAAATSPRLRGEVDARSASGEGDSRPAEPAESPPLPASGEREVARAGGGEPHDRETFDPASLPPIESIDAGTDVSAFLRPGVPADLAQAALRRAWVTDPAIRDFVGLAENSWDFNAPGGVPGFEPLRAIDDVQRLAAQVIGALPAAPPETPPAEDEETAGMVVACDEPVAEQSRPETTPPAENVATQNDQSTEKT